MYDYNDTQYDADASNAAYKGTKSFVQQQVKTVNATGFGSAGDDHAERGIDLNEQLITNKPATFFFKMRGNAMIDAGIHDGDTLIVDRSITQVNGRIVIANLNGEMLVRRLERTINKIRLIPETKQLAIIDVDPYVQFMIWGVVTYTIHKT